MLFLLFLNSNPAVANIDLIFSVGRSRLGGIKKADRLVANHSLLLAEARVTWRGRGRGDDASILNELGFKQEY